MFVCLCVCVFVCVAFVWRRGLCVCLYLIDIAESLVSLVIELINKYSK